MHGDKVSVVIPHMPFDGAEAMLKRCVNSLDGYDELVVVVNDGIGFGKAVNQGLALASGDYIFIVNNDTTLCSGNLRSLCKPDTVTVPRMATGQVDNQPRAFFCLPKSVYEQVGGYDEQFTTGYFEDDDLIRRLHDKHVPIELVESVEVDHIGGATMKQFENRTAIFDENKKRYAKKWGNV